MMVNNKDELMFCKRAKELAMIAEKKGICTYSDFLNLNEISLFYRIQNEMPNVHGELFGGYEEAERKILCLYTDDCFDKPEYPIQCVHIKPCSKKFSEELTHRDFLGAILNLGIDRSKIGDISIMDKEGYVFTNSMISRFLIDNLTKIKHTSIESDYIDISIVPIQQNTLEITGTVSSIRLDAVLSVAFKSSRSSLIGYISGGKVFVNGKLIESNSYLLNENDIVSVRGLGKFKYITSGNQTKKGRNYITLQKYV